MATARDDTPPVPTGRIELKYASFRLFGAASELYYGSLSLFCPSPWSANESPSFVDFSFHLFQEWALSRGHMEPRAWVAHVGSHAIVFGHHASWLVAIACLDSWLKLGLASPGGHDIEFYAMDTAEFDEQFGCVLQLQEEA